ncbi:MAG TPA: hydantoinase B/oxoprolinase family protein [Acidimicrobiales bacterium]|nr:hydantoinase B/oxoprolinase family protein [Acidimicrobiales bacterium]
MRFRVGTDVGGTFTDLWVLADNGRQAVLKSSSTPDIIRGVVRTVELAAEHFDLSVEDFCSSVERFGHGTTAGLNALLTGSLPRTATVMTAGFGDTLEIGRLKRQIAGLSDVEIRDYTNRGRRAPLVPRTLVFEVRERIDRNGTVVVPLSEQDALDVVERVAAAGVEAVAVSTLWSVANPVHEQELGRLLRLRLPEASITLSHEVAPVVGEYGRASTAVVDATLGPVLTRYLEHLQEALGQLGLKVPVLVMTSEGGVITAKAAAARPVSVLMSGPAAGVIGCQRLAAQLGCEYALAVDVGGTSFDVGTIVKGHPIVRTEFSLAGSEIQRPAIDVSTIGAGGGSIASLRNGALRVGPESAGAHPGPACYGRGGNEPTGTDADLILGVFSEDGFSSGAMKLDVAAARQVITREIAEPLRIDVIEAAWGIRRVLDSKMADLLRSVTVEKGLDPRDFVLFAGGGQGPSHAWALCQELGISSFVVSPFAAAQSAIGIGTSDAKTTVQRPHYVRLAPNRPPSAEVVLALGNEASSLARDALSLARSDIAEGSSSVRTTAAIRYRGQAHHLDVMIEEDLSSVSALERTITSFETQYESLYGAGSAFREAGIEILSLRATATIALPGSAVPSLDGALIPVGERSVIFDDPRAPQLCPVYRTSFPGPDLLVLGPCLVEFPGQTLVVPPGAEARTDQWGNFVVTLASSPALEPASSDALEALNPITYEVIRNRLLNVTEEMRIALQSVSGSPTVTEASDFFTGLYLPDGSFATMGLQVTHEAPPVGALIRHLNTRGSPLRPGDMFIGNDPYVGALHQNDVQMTTPIFDGDRLVAWAGVMAHETDVGGMNFASWCPTATEVYQEGLRIPAVKLVDEGVLREDVLEMILTASRLPASLGLDVRAFIATLNVATERLRVLFERYGAGAVSEIMVRMIDETERETRLRLIDLPDGRVHVRDFLEHDGHENRLYTVDLVATKRADALVLDFSGSSPQAPGFINATRSGLRGGVAGALIPTLGFGQSWNEGLLRPVEIVAPDGLICTALHPAPVGSATVETIWTVTNVVQHALNLLMACSDRFASRSQAVSSGTMATFNLGGFNELGERFGLHLLDPLAGGSGAYVAHDGIDAGGPIAVPVPAIADVESNEQVFPLLYRYRRMRPDTGGPGTTRGGRAGEIALGLWGIESATALVMTHGAEVPNSVGLSGGAPGSTVRQRFSSSHDHVHAPREFDLDEGGANWTELGPKPGSIVMHRGDTFAVSWQGGGGIGDPLLRAPESIEEDVRRGAVTAERARRVYGVVLDQGRVDDDATRSARLILRSERLGHAPTGESDPDAPGLQLGPALRVIRGDDGFDVRTRAGALLSRNSTRWRPGAISRTLNPDELEIVLHDELMMTGYFCPISGELLSIDVHRRDDEPLDELDLDFKL